MSAPGRTRVGLLPLYLDLYDRLLPGMRDGFAPMIDEVESILEACGLDVVSVGIVATHADVERAVATFGERDVELVATLHLSYSPSLLVADTIESLGVPVLVLDTTISPAFAPEEPRYLSRNHGIHGVMDLTSVLTSRGIAFRVAAGHYRGDRFRAAVGDAVKPLVMAARFRNQRIGLTGEPFEGMGDFAIPFDELHRLTGTQVERISVADLAEAAAGVPADAVADQVEHDRAHIDFSAVEPSAHEASVRAYLALAAIAAERGLTGYTMNFLSFGEAVSVPFYACTRLSGDGIGYAGEGDVLTASLARPLEAAADRAMFNEMFCADWQTGRILMAHMGETNLRFARRGERPVARVRKAMGNPHDSVTFHFRKEPTEVTVVNVSPDRRHGLRFVSFLARIVDSPVYDAVEHPHFQIEPPGEVADFLERYARCGGGHHLYLATGDVREEIRAMVDLLGFALEEA